MALTITARLIRSADTPQTAKLTSQADAGSWRVSWLPDRRLTRAQAEAAMSIAEAVGQMPSDCDPELYDDTFWTRVDAWAAELGLASADAVVQAIEPPAEASADE
jgi:hypothetical protein